MMHLYDLTDTLRRGLSPLLLATFATSTLMMIGVGQAQADGSNGWKEHYDARLHVGILLPTGWTMKTEGYTLVAQSADRASVVLAEAFVNAPGESAQSRIAKLSATHSALFPQAHVDRLAPQPSQQGDTLLGALSYRQAQGGSGQARVLCSVFQQSGMLYAVGAPNTQFAKERPALFQILQSLRFGPPPGTAPAHTPVAAGNGAATGAHSVEFVKWTDPKEHAFTVDVPRGWKVEGGMYRVASSDTRASFRVTAPGDDMLIQVGDQSLPQYLLVPTQQAMRTYNVPIGVPFIPNNTLQNMLLPYMHAAEFNKWYIDKALRPGVENLEITHEQDVPEAAHQQAEEANRIMRGSAHASCSVGATEFKGRSKMTGKPIVGVITSTTSLITSTMNPNMPNWNAQVIVLGCNVDDKTAVHQQILKTILARIEQSLQMDPEWQRRLNQQMGQETNAILKKGQNEIQKTGELSKQIAANADANRKRIMSSYWNHVNAQNEQQRNFANYIGDKTDVVDPNTGQTAKVASGYSNYYHDPRTGTILGTNSTDRPPVDFTPMKEF